MLAAAAAQPDRLVVGVDANAAGMATASRRAAARPARGGLPNALFVLAAAEALPAELERSIQSWIETWNENPRPFVWAKTADEILDTITRYCQRINNSGH